MESIDTPVGARRGTLEVVLLAWMTCAGCADASGRADAERETRVVPAVGLTSAALISDGAHLGNGHMFFLPPLVAAPSTSGAFDAEQPLEIEICEWDGAACAVPLVARYTRSTGPGSETVRVEPADEHYVVNWHTDEFELDPASTYRIVARVAGTVLAFADVDVVGAARELKSVGTGQFISLLDGRTLPIKLRVEVGAVFPVGDDGGEISALDGDLILDVPPGALAGDLGITVERVQEPAPPGVGLLDGTLVELGPDGTLFDAPVSVSLAYDPGALPAGVTEEMLTLIWEEGDGWAEAANAGVDTAADRVFGSIDHFSKGGAGTKVDSLELLPADGQVGIGETLQYVAVPRDAAGTVLVGRNVSWKVADTTVASIDRDGLATALSPGTTSVTASVGNASATAAFLVDLCPDDDAKYEPGVCGCGTPDDDTDGDGVEDCNEGCPGDPLKTDAGVCGCGVPEPQDADGDGHTVLGSCQGSADDCDDLDPNNFPGNLEACDGVDNDCDGFANEVDTDNDGLCDDYDSDDDGDGCPDAVDPAPRTASGDSDLDGQADDCDPDDDNDGLLDSEELALRTNPYLPDTDGDGLLDGEEQGLGGDPRFDELLGLDLDPASLNLLPGDTDAMAAYGYYTFAPHVPQDITGSVDWSSSDGRVGIDPDGVVTGVALGDDTITASFRGMNAEAPGRVWDAGRLEMLSELVVSPGGVLYMSSGDCIQLTATATYTDGSSEDLTGLVRWLVSGLYETVPREGFGLARRGLTNEGYIAPGLFVANGWRTQYATTIATLEGVMGSAIPYIGGISSQQLFEGSCADPRVPGELWGMRVTPSSSTLMVGQATELTVSGLYADGSTRQRRDLRELAFRSATPATTEVSFDGWMRGLADGDGVVRVALDDRYVMDVPVSVVPTGPFGTLQELRVEPSALNTTPGESYAVRALARYDGQPGRLFDVTASTDWFSTAPEVAAPILGEGTAGQIGSTVLTAQLEGQRAISKLRVWDPARLDELVDISVKPPGVQYVDVDRCVNYAALATFSDGSTEPLTDAVQWSTGSPNAATIDFGLYRQLAPAGYISVEASFQELGLWHTGVTYRGTGAGYACSAP